MGVSGEQRTPIEGLLQPQGQDPSPTVPGFPGPRVSLTARGHHFTHAQPEDEGTPGRSSQAVTHALLFLQRAAPWGVRVPCVSSLPSFTDRYLREGCGSRGSTSLPPRSTARTAVPAAGLASGPALRQPCCSGPHQRREPGGAERRPGWNHRFLCSQHPRPGFLFGMLQDGGPHGAARGDPGAESASASSLPGRCVAAVCRAASLDSWEYVP